MGVLRSYLAVAYLLVISPPSSGSSREASSPETYAVYSAILSPPPLSLQDQDARYAIADTTSTAKEGLDSPRAACQLPPSISESFAQMNSEFEKRKNTPVHLKKEFTLRKPYVLLTPQEVANFIYHGDRPKGVTNLITVSDVYFNRSKTVAMVHVNAYCGGLCGLFGWHVMEKSAAGQWHESMLAVCGSAIA